MQKPWPKGHAMFDTLSKQIGEVKDTKQREELVNGFSIILAFLHNDFNEPEFVKDCMPKEKKKKKKKCEQK